MEIQDDSVQDRKYYHSFNTIKLICIFLTVTAGHYWQYSPGAYWAGGDNPFLTSVTNMVVHFTFRTYSLIEFLLMLSGYQMYYYYDRIRNGQVSFNTYLKGRVKRLFPLAVGSTVLIAAGQFFYEILYQQPWYDIELNGHLLVENLLCIQSWVNPSATMNRSLWFLSAYFFCLILFYWLTIIGKKSGMGIWCMMFPILISFCGYGRNYAWLLFNNDMCRGYLGFFIGVMVAAWMQTDLSARSKFKTFFAVSMIALWILFREKYPRFTLEASLFDRVTFCVLFLYIPLLWLLVRIPSLEHILGNPFFRKISVISFYMYVLNMPIYVWTAVIEKMIGHSLIPYNLAQGFWISVLVQITVSALFYFLVQRCKKVGSKKSGA